mgnify:FL=1
MIYYKALQPDGTSFHDPAFRWATEPGGITKHPNPAASIARKSGAKASGYLSVAAVPTDCTSMRWPCMLLAVEPVGRVALDDEYPNKRRGRAFRTVEQLDPVLALGPQGADIALLIERAVRLTFEQADAIGATWRAALPVWDAAWYAAWYAARHAARDAAWHAARDAAWHAARDAAGDAARDAAWHAARDAAVDAAWDAAWYTTRHAARGAAAALVVADLVGTHGLTQDHIDTLLAPWVMGHYRPLPLCLVEQPADDLAEQGRKLASARDDLIAQGFDPADLILPLYPSEARP